MPRIQKIKIEYLLPCHNSYDLRYTIYD
jgi:hypothetical protein